MSSGQSSAKTLIDQGAMSAMQWTAILVTVALNALDGFDVLSISFAVAGIAAEWRVDNATLGWVLACGLLGMAVGSLLLGGVADRIGRRPTILGCLAAMTLGMYGATLTSSVAPLLLCRLLTGLGIGGMVAALNAVAAATAALIPAVWLWVPESVAFLQRLQGAGALARVNRVLRHFGQDPLVSLVAVPASSRGSLFDLFRPGLAVTTLLITFASCAHMTSFYFILKWVPKIMVDLGFTQAQAAGVLKWVNVGGASGGALFGLIGARVTLRRLTLVTLAEPPGGHHERSRHTSGHQLLLLKLANFGPLPP